MTCGCFVPRGCHREALVRKRLQIMQWGDASWETMPVLQVEPAAAWPGGAASAAAMRCTSSSATLRTCTLQRSYAGRCAQEATATPRSRGQGSARPEACTQHLPLGRPLLCRCVCSSPGEPAVIVVEMGLLYPRQSDTRTRGVEHVLSALRGSSRSLQIIKEVGKSAGKNRGRKAVCIGAAPLYA